MRSFCCAFLIVNREHGQYDDNSLRFRVEGEGGGGVGKDSLEKVSALAFFLFLALTHYHIPELSKSSDFTC